MYLKIVIYLSQSEAEFKSKKKENNAVCNEPNSHTFLATLETTECDGYIYIEKNRH